MNASEVVRVLWVRLEANVLKWEHASNAEERREAEEAIEFLDETLREMGQKGIFQ